MADLNKAIMDVEQANAWDEGDEVVQIKVKKPLYKVIIVRATSQNNVGTGL